MENCAAVCVVCHRWKTAMVDIPSVAKGRRIQDRYLGLLKPGGRFSTNRSGRFKRKVGGEIVLRVR